jgi:polyisoprenoid-binding protein YceI
MIAVFLLSASALPLSAATYEIDPAHSAVTFQVAHLTISKVHGRFDRFSGSIEYTPGKPELWKTSASIETASINTNMEARDKHLRSADFFNVEKFPAMTFKSTKAAGVKGMAGKLLGELTLLGVTKPVVLEVQGHGPVKDPWGGERLGAVAKTTINRKDFGMVWNQVLDSGGVMIGDEVEVTLEIECVRKP